MGMKQNHSGGRVLSPTEVTVAAALQLPALQRGAPEVVAGEAQLARPVRWVHIAETRAIASMLRGGELLLSQGMLFRGSDADRHQLVTQLAECGIAGLILELGAEFQSVPRSLIAEFEHHALPLIALHVEVPFVAVTEAIHTCIVYRQSELLIEGESVQRRLTELALGGAAAPELLDAVAYAVGNPVILEREGGGIAHQAPHGCLERDVVAAWERFVRGLPSASPAIERRLPSVRGEELGRVVALGLSAPLGQSEETVIDRSLGIISLVLWQSRHEEALAARAHRGFLSGLVAGDIAPISAMTRAAAAGFDSPALLPVAISRARHHGLRLVAAEDRLWTQVWQEVIAELEQRLMQAIVDPQPTTSTTLAMVGLDDVSRRSTIAERFASLVAGIAERRFGAQHPVVISVGPAVHTWPAAAAALTVAIDALRSAAFARPRLWHDAVDLDLDRLLWSLRDNPDLVRFAKLRLDRLVDHDSRRKTQLVQTLEALLETNGHKADAARILHLERQSLYSRIARIQDLLDADLSDPETLLSLHLALRVRAMLPESQARNDSVDRHDPAP